MADESNRNQGEGNREAAERFNEAEKRYVESPKGEEKIREGVHVRPEEERALTEAERLAKGRAKAQDSGTWPEPSDKR
ncbi:MAG TPA: hypothetical protein VHX52_04800 [Steroidobacteraceae bacterium]|jgi:hypothetical protein|nr:hypothetical protein [Steroidobacteraceae bacterium]